MKRETLCIAYTGEAVDSGAMSVNDLAPALLSLSNLIGEANRILNKDESRIDVRLSAHLERGSFEMSFELIQSITEQIKLFFGGGVSLSELLNSIGLFNTITGLSLIGLIRWIKNRNIDKVEKLNEEKVRVIIAEESREVTLSTWLLYRSHKVRQHIEGVLHPLTKEGVDTFEVRDKSNAEVVERITSEEIDTFKSEPKTPIREITSKREIYLRIISISFDRNLKWRFDNGESKLTATITDETFWSKVESGVLSFRLGDTLLAVVESKQQVMGDAIKEQNVIVAVNEVLTRDDADPN